jgi:hypothetical protein
MKKAAFVISIIALIIQVFTCIALGIEIFVVSAPNPDTMITEAIIMGICLVIEIICVFYRLYANKQ